MAKKKIKKVPTSFKAIQEIKFKLIDGKAEVNLASSENFGKEITVSILIDNKGIIDNKATWSIDLSTDCNNYLQTRTIPNDVTTKWDWVETNDYGPTNAKIYIYNTSGLKDTQITGGY